MSYKDDFESRSTLLNTYGNNALLLYALHRLTRAHSPLSCAMDK